MMKYDDMSTRTFTLDDIQQAVRGANLRRYWSDLENALLAAKPVTTMGTTGHLLIPQAAKPEAKTCASSCWQASGFGPGGCSPDCHRAGRPLNPAPAASPPACVCPFPRTDCPACEHACPACTDAFNAANHSPPAPYPASFGELVDKAGALASGQLAAPVWLPLGQHPGGKCESLCGAWRSGGIVHCSMYCRDRAKAAPRDGKPDEAPLSERARGLFDALNQPQCEAAYVRVTSEIVDLEAKLASALRWRKSETANRDATIERLSRELSETHSEVVVRDTRIAELERRILRALGCLSEELK